MAGHILYVLSPCQPLFARRSPVNNQNATSTRFNL